MADDASDYRDMLAELEATYGPSNIEERRARLMDRLAAEQTATARYSGDELEAPQGYITPAKAVRWVNTDAGPMAVDAEGNSLPLIQQPGVLPLYRDPTIDTVRMASPRVLDIVGDMMGAPLGMTAARVLRAGVKGERPAANVVNIFAGESAKTADMDKLSDALWMSDHNIKTPEQIRRETGWFQGADEQWRFEVPDYKAKIDTSPLFNQPSRFDIAGDFFEQNGVPRKKMATGQFPDLDKEALAYADKVLAERPPVKLGEILDHPALFEAYPEAAEIPVHVTSNASHRGSFNPATGEMKLGYGLSGDKPDAILSTALHELQHYVQTKEGFARGANTTFLTENSPAWDLYQKRLKKMKTAPSLKEWAKNAGYDSLDEARPSWEAFKKELKAGSWKKYDIEAQKSALEEAYRRSAGEVEARNVQARRLFDEEAGLRVSPKETQSIPDKEQLVQFRNANPEMDYAQGGSVDGGLDGLVQKYDLPGYAEGGPALPSYDPMGSFTGMEGVDQDGRDPGLYERLADEMAAAGMSVGEPVRQAAEGISDVPSSIAKYIAETSEKPDPSQRVAEDIRRFGGAFADQAMSSPTEFAKTVGGFIPGIGEAISAYDAKNLYGDLQKAEAEGDTGRADTLRQLYGLASAGAIPGVGMAARVAGKARAARELSPMGFYSYGAETAAGLPQAKGSPDQMAAMLQKYGVKPDEMYATGFANESATAAARSKIEAEFAPRVAEAQRAMEGLEPGTPEFKAAERQFKNISSTMRSEMDRALVLGDEWSARPSVTRDEIAAHFKERMPQIEETVLGRDQLSLKERHRYYDLDDAVAKDGVNALSPEQQQEYYALQKKWNQEKPTKFGQYSLPGGENYREVLLKLPNPGDALNARRLEIEKIGAAATLEQRQEWADIMNRLRPDSSDVEGVQKYKNFPDFRSQHWDDPNVLAHLRMADRTGPNGEKILHVEEIQSDWGQKGKKEGFVDRSQNWDQQYKDFQKKAVSDWVDMKASNVFEKNPELYGSMENAREVAQTASKHYGMSRIAEDLGLSEAHSNLYEKMNQYRNGVPTAPYVTNTQAWTDLALKRALREAAEGGYDKLVWTPGAEQAKRYDLSKQIDKLVYNPQSEILMAYKDGQQVINRGAAKDELEGLVGKEVAKNLLATEGQTIPMAGNATYHILEGQDLSVGGSGMKGYYDKIVPTQLSKLVKKLDPEAKLGTHEIRTTKESDLRRKLRDEGYDPDQIELQELLSDNGGRAPRGFTEADLDAMERGEHFGGVSQKGVTAPSLTITPKMREAILGGQTAYAEGGSVQDSGATEAADLDTLFQKYADSGYATGGSVSPQAMANDNLVYDPDEIEAIAAQIRGAN